MKLYPDGVAEGTPEEVAAFKHIDAALAARNKRSQLAIEGPKPKPAKKATPKKATKTSHKATVELYEQILGLASTQSVTAAMISQYFELDKKTAYNMLYRLRVKGLIARDPAGNGFRATQAVSQ